ELVNECGVEGKKHMKKVMVLAWLCVGLAVPIQSDGWVACGGRGYGAVAYRAPCWHPGWSCGGVCTGMPAAAGFAGFAAGAAVGAAVARPTVVAAPPPVVVAPPVRYGSIYYSLPSGTQDTYVGGQEYYVFAGTYYQPFCGSNGVYYEAVAPPL